MFYDRSGNVYRGTTIGDGTVLVYQQIDDGEEGPRDGELRMVKHSELSDSPPRAHVDEEIAKLRGIARGLQVEIAEKRRELRDFEAEFDCRMKRLKQHKALERLDQFLAGQITHYVEYNSYSLPKIIRLEDAKSDVERNSRDLKLLSLFGKSKGDLSWGLNRYSDGSGSYMDVVPCTSHEEALKVTAQIFAAHEAKALDPETKQTPRSDWLKRADEYEIQTSDEYRQALLDIGAAQREDRARELRAELAKLESPT